MSIDDGRVTVSMIPRIRVQYNVASVLQAAGIHEEGVAQREALITSFKERFWGTFPLLTGSGRGALYFLLRSLRGRPVIVPSYTCNAVVEAARLAGSEIRYAAVSPDDYNMIPASVEKVVTAGSIVLATHQYGIPCRIREIAAIARRAGALVVEDCAAALGSLTEGQACGSFGDAAFFSFDTTKLLQVPLKAGVLLLRSEELFNAVRADQAELAPSPSAVRRASTLARGTALVALRNPILYRVFHQLHFALRGRYTAETDELATRPGSFYREPMREWQAHLANRQLQRLDATIAVRRRHYAAYRHGLAGVSGIVLPPADERAEWACVRFPIRVPGDKMRFYRHCARAGVDFGFSFTHLAAPPEFTEARSLAASVLNLPFDAQLSDAERERVIDVVKWAATAL